MQLLKIENNINIFSKGKRDKVCSFILLNGIVTYIKLRLKSNNMKHLTESQRYTIEMMLSKGYTKSKIAETIEVDKSTVYREIHRNCDARDGTYRSKLAHRKSMERKHNKPQEIRFTSVIQQTIVNLLMEDYSPEQIVGYCRNEGMDCVSHERIYQYIWEDKRRGGSLYKHLRRQDKRYRKRGSLKDTRGIIPNKPSIDNRPEIVDDKTRLGDLEIDTIIGKNHKGAIVTINDRATGSLWMKKVVRRTADLVSKAAIELLEPYKPMLHTITADNGKEFAYFEKIAEELEIEFYFANPYCSWERGANENLNGLVRQYIPKTSDFSKINDDYISTITRKLNKRPRKRHGFLNPDQKLSQLINQVAFEG